MHITVGNHTITQYSEVSVSLRYNSIADTFTFKLFFDPYDAAHRAIFKPGTYQDCKIYHNNQLLIVGKVLAQNFTDGPKRQLAVLSGYSTTGVFHDCSVYGGAKPIAGETIKTDSSIEFVNMSLAQIARAVLNSYGFPDPVIDDNVKDRCDTVFAKRTAGITQTVESFLSDAASQLHVVLSHTIDGNGNDRVLFTKCGAAKNLQKQLVTAGVMPATKGVDIDGAVFVTGGNTITAFIPKPIYSFKSGQPIWTNMGLNVNGQQMHSDIQVVGQQTTAGTNSPDAKIKNPYVQNTFRFARRTQTAGDPTDSDDTARDVLADELKAVSLNIDIVGWELNNTVIRPNQIITANNPYCYLYNDTRFFIESVDFVGDTKSETCSIGCVLPEVYNDEDVVNIFNQ